MKMQYRSLLIGSMLLFATTVLAQSARPTLTTEDVVKWRAAHPDRAEHFIPQQAAAKPTPPAQTDEKFLAAERDWNARLVQARERVRDLERRADEVDLAATQSRNNIFHADANALNATNARVAELKGNARAYRAEARAAQAAVNQLLDEGREYGFQIQAMSPTLKNGEPNMEYYRERFLALQRELQDAQARADVLQQRVNRLQTQINSTLNYPPLSGRGGILFYPNNGAADGFYLNRLRDELGGVGGDYQATQARLAILTEQMMALQEEGRRAGLPAGIFR